MTRLGLSLQGERGPPGVNGTQGFQGCPGQRGVKVRCGVHVWAGRAAAVQRGDGLRGAPGDPSGGQWLEPRPELGDKGALRRGLRTEKSFPMEARSSQGQSRGWTGCGPEQRGGWSRASAPGPQRSQRSGVGGSERGRMPQKVLRVNCLIPGLVNFLVHWLTFESRCGGGGPPHLKACPWLPGPPLLPGEPSPPMCQAGKLALPPPG